MKKNGLLLLALFALLFAWSNSKNFRKTGVSPLLSERSETVKEKKFNRLIHEKSPYLLKHADNPVDWYPWGDEAFEKARAEDKPVFLSIGYSTCHWCNVMERESYNDKEVADLMNADYIAIKVDREERPDIDQIYMTACQMISRNGCGWPLNLIMTPDRKPFFAATYIPKRARFGRPGMMDILPRIKTIWDERRNDVISSADQVMGALQKISTSKYEGKAGVNLLDTAYEKFNETFDDKYGGFGHAPKFPSPHNLLFLLRYWKRTGYSRALLMVEKTLEEMGKGGIFDHVGFGFHRYSTDRQWIVPHFEKMLYDQALLAMAYTEAFQATGKHLYEETARKIFRYVLRDMTSPNGAFYSAEDADSEGEEGKFYLWTMDEVEKVLGKEEAHLITVVFNLKEGGNFVDSVSGTKTGTNIFYLDDNLSGLAAKLGIAGDDIEKRIESARRKLFAAREKRIHPLKDDKILTDWNGMMAAALAKASQAFDEPEYAEAARRSVDFLMEKMRTDDGGLLHRYRQGEAAIPGMLDDYAYLTWGMLELYETGFNVKYLRQAIALTDYMLEHFWDRKDGGFFFRADDGEKLPVRWKDFADAAIPSGNGVAMLNLLRLGRITGNTGYEEKADRLASIIAGLSNGGASTAYTMSLTALDFGIGPTYEVVVAGESSGEDTRAMLKELRKRFIPDKVVILRPQEEEHPDITKIARFTENQKAVNGKATAYVCHNYNCNLPTTDIKEMIKQLEGGEPSIDTGGSKG